ncbi:class I SAM-dependent methyltransferase [Streptomyces sp. NPDC093982]|uniref:class I SAM-dependent methyltransferase n=1 Tax=Streptomyces sp. NPDC093982 TaxID=3155077 RepID=UPI00342B8947
MAATQSTPAVRRPRTLDDVPGWFPPLDQVLFDWLLDRQQSAGMRGDLLEVGVFMGKSAIFTGQRLQPGERYTVCDLFEGDAPDDANKAESAKSYSALTRQAFEENYLSFHDELPRVLQGPSSIVPDEVPADSCRFVHVDGSHLYEHVYGDIGAAHDLLLPDGVVVLDDFRSEHTPGVAIATWEAVINRGLRPICLSTQKLYATWGDPEPVQEELLAMVRARTDCHLSVQQAAGHRIIRLKAKGTQAPPFPPSRHADSIPAEHSAPTAPAAASAARPARPKPPRSRARKLAADVLPPVVTRAIRNARRRAR